MGDSRIFTFTYQAGEEQGAAPSVGITGTNPGSQIPDHGSWITVHGSEVEQVRGSSGAIQKPGPGNQKLDTRNPRG